MWPREAGCVLPPPRHQWAATPSIYLFILFRETGCHFLAQATGRECLYLPALSAGIIGVNHAQLSSV